MIHLAEPSNDPVGNLNPDCICEINRSASLRLGWLVREARVERFLFASSCSLYGACAAGLLTEESGFNSVTPDGESKVLVEREVGALDERLRWRVQRSDEEEGQ